MRNQKGVSMVTLVITIIVILLLAGVTFIGSIKTVEKTNYSKYVTNVSDVSGAFGESAAIVKGKKIMEDKKKEMEQIHNYLAKNGAEEKDFLKVDDVPEYTIIRNEGQLGINLPDMQVESGTGKKVHVKYAATSQGKIFTWPPLEHEDKLYITDKDTVEHKMQTLIKVGDEEFRIKIDSGDGSLLDWLIETSDEDDDDETPSGDDGDSPSGHQHVFTSQTQTDAYFCSDATCTVPKKYYYKCISCDAKGTTTYTVGSALGHTFAGETLIKEANCTEKGAVQSKCTRCGTFANFDRPINSANHHGGERVEIIKKATCVETGSKTIMCASCNAVLRTERIDTTDHDMDKVVITKQATCTEKGIKTFKCSGCGKEMKTEEIEALGHGDERVEILQSATCTEKGIKAYKCSICNVQMRTEEIEATGHSYGSFQVTKEATCKDEGVMTQTCSRCGDEITEKIPKDTSKHYGTEETKTVDEATCLDEGTVEIICSSCKAVLQTQAVAALGHDWNSPTLPRKCNRCGLEETKSCTYNVVYQSTSGLELGSTTVTKDLGTTNTIVAPEITGYNTPASQDVIWDSETKTITFEYTPISYSITIDCNGGRGVTSTSYTIETETFTLGTPTMTGYTFTGWTGSNGTTPQTTVSIDKGSIGARNYTANWKGNDYTYNVIYKSASGLDFGGTTVTKEYGTTNTIVAPEITGYNTPESQDVTWDSEIKIITFTYTPTSYSVTIDCNGGSGVTSTSYTIETETFTLGTPTRTEHIFTGWTGSNGTTPQTSVSIDKGSIGARNYTANWTANQYTYNIVYQSTSGISLGSATVTKEYGTTNTITAPGKLGYNTPASQDVTWDSTTAKTITFTYTPISYSVTIDCNGGTGVSSTSYTIETATFTLGTPTRTNYTFIGWTGSNGDDPETSVTISKGSIGALSYTANWEANNTLPTFTYTGEYEIVDENDNIITETNGNWKIRFLTSGILTFYDLGSAANGIDAFLVGGGGGGSGIGSNCGGGGGGYTTTQKYINITTNTEYEIQIGDGGGSSQDGGSSTAFGITASGGSSGGGGGYMIGGLRGGTGGTGGGSGYSSGGTEIYASTAGLGGADGTGGLGSFPGSGQGTTTREFAEPSGTLYSKGGDGGKASGGDFSNATANTGNGGAGGGYSGGSGIVIIRASSTNPYFTYTGSYEITDENDNPIDSLTGNWKIRFLTSGTLTFNDLSNITDGIDAFLVGGGGGGGSRYSNYGGGGGGYTTTYRNMKITTNTPYTIQIGYGGSANNDGGSTTAFGLTVSGGSAGGTGGYMIGGLLGGNGGTGGGAGYSAGGTEIYASTAGLGGTDGNGGGGSFPGSGQGTTTREFSESSGTLYSKGGDGGQVSGGYFSQPAVNTGAGGAGGGGYSGASGIVIIRASVANPDFTYTGSYEITDENDNPIDSLTGNWKIRFLTSGTLTFHDLSNIPNGIDAFLVGGGGGGGSRYSNYGGGGGGYTTTHKNMNITLNTPYTIEVGAGGSANVDGSSTSAFGLTVSGGGAGGTGGYMIGGLLGGSGGNGGGAGYSAGGTEIYASTAGLGGTDGNGGGGSFPGSGQGTTTREFSESSGILYAKGGDGGQVSGGTFSSGGVNTGNGGAGGGGYSGGSGIVIIRASSINPYFTYTGTYELIDDNGNTINSLTGNWKIRFLTSGTLTFNDLGNAENGIDVFCVGGGGGGGSRYSNYAGGGGGCTTTQKNISIATNTPYTIEVGAGGSANVDGGSSSGFGITASGGGKGGAGGAYVGGLLGGSGGSGGGAGYSSGGTEINASTAGLGGTDGADGEGTYSGSGQGTTTREFGETSGTLYSKGGDGGTSGGSFINGAPNTGNGGAGGGGYSGGSGIVVIRNKR